MRRVRPDRRAKRAASSTQYIEALRQDFVKGAPAAPPALLLNEGREDRLNSYRPLVGLVVNARAFASSGVESVRLARLIRDQFGGKGRAWGVLVTEIPADADGQFQLVRAAEDIGFVVSACEASVAGVADSRTLLAAWGLLMARDVHRLIVAANDTDVAVVRDWAQMARKPLTVVRLDRGRFIVKEEGSVVANDNVTNPRRLRSTP